MDTIIIGGGASGILAALTAAEQKDSSVTLLERHSRIGRKLMATGNGRCNITNTGNSDGHYHGRDSSFSSYALEQFSPEDSLSYFSSLGLLTTEQYGGRVYPLSDSANSVVDVFRFYLDKAGVRVLTGTEVRAAGKNKGGFDVVTDRGVLHSDNLIIACGGKAGGKLGGVEDGYRILESFGHARTRLYPALVPISTENEFTKPLKGVRCDAAVSLNGICRRGEVQFTDNGISGPAAFDISRTAAIDGGVVEIDFLPDIEDPFPILSKRREELPSLECGSLLTGILHNRLGLVLIKYSGIRPSSTIGTLSETQLKKISVNCKHFRLRVRGVGSFDSAQITVGGIVTADFNPRTMESRLVKHLYACGEVLDVDGDCGGYNLRWAWASGRLAGSLLS